MPADLKKLTDNALKRLSEAAETTSIAINNLMMVESIADAMGNTELINNLKTMQNELHEKAFMTLEKIKIELSEATSKTASIINFASEEEALQYLSNLTGKRIKVAEDKASESETKEFIDQYIKTMLWSSTDESDERGGEPMDKNYNKEDIAKEFMESIKADCKKFINENYPYIQDDMTGAAHDFWLTRNGHGAGFWDGDWEFEIDVNGQKKNAGKHLTDISKAYGEVNPYVGDDGKIYGM